MNRVSTFINYTKILGFLLVLFTGNCLHAQNELEQLRKEVDQIKKRLIENEEKDKLKVGYLTLKRSGSTIFDKNDKPIHKNIKIEDVNIKIHDGYIVLIQVNTDRGKFLNKRAPIELSASRFGKCDWLHKEGNGGDYIKICDLLNLTQLNSYVPDNVAGVLSSEKDTIPLFKGIGINNLFEIKLFSDAIGVFGGESNGLTQTDISFRQVLNRSNLPNIPLFFFHDLRFNLLLSRFDEKFSSIDTTNFTRTAMWQRSWFTGTVAINSFTYYYKRHSLNAIYFDGGGGISASNVAYTSDTTTTLSRYGFLEPGLRIKIAGNADFNFAWRFIWFQSPETDFKDQDKILLLNSPTIGISWHPNGSPANAVFGRLNYVFAKDEPKSHFMQLQLGYTITLSKLLK